MEDFKLDRTIVRARSFEDAEKDKLFPAEMPVAERIKMAFHLSCTIFGIKKGDPLKIDTTIFSARKFS